MDDLIINMSISVLLGVIKNTSKREHLKAALLKVRNAINAAFPSE